MNDCVIGASEGKRERRRGVRVRSKEKDREKEERKGDTGEGTLKEEDNARKGDKGRQIKEEG